VVQLHRDIDRLTAAGAGVTVIGNGAPTFIEGFREVTGYTGPIYTDPSLAAYRAAALRRGLATVLTLGTLSRSVGAFRRGFRQGSVQGDTLQQGGTLIVDTSGVIVFRYISKGPGDHAATADMLAALARR
jgi:AhpC/TSA antioxidant enzyme